MKPFEGLFGNTAELKLLEYLLPLDGIEFTMPELAKENKLSKIVTTRIIKKFVDYDILKLRYEDNIEYYSINKESYIAKLFEDINNVLIEKILGEDMLYKIYDYWKIRSESHI